MCQFSDEEWFFLLLAMQMLRCINWPGQQPKVLDALYWYDMAARSSKK